VETVTNLTALLVRASDTGGYFAMHKVRAPASADAPLWPTGLIVDTLPRRGDFPKSLKMLTDLAVLVFWHVDCNADFADHRRAARQRRRVES
jgi:hypothetical protein